MFIDGSKYQIRRMTELQKVSLDENDLVKSFSSEEADASYRFDSSSFAKALFEYSDDQLKTISATSDKNKYKLSTSFNFSSGIAIVGNNLNNPVVESILGSLPETDIDTGMYVTFSNGEILSYSYEMNIDITNLKFSLVYDLTFKNVGKSQNITPRAFTGLALSSEEIQNSLNEINAYLIAFTSKAHSSYDFELTTGVDYGMSTNEINATFKGSTQRKIIDNKVYFHNDIEINSDYKNADLYKAAGIEDVHIKRTVLSTGEVYNIEKLLLADKTYLIEGYSANRSDSFYLFDILGQIKNFTYFQKVVNAKEGEIEFSLGLSSSEVANLLGWFNGELDLDPLGNATAAVKVFGDFEKASIVSKDIKFVITVKDGALISISLEADGYFNTAFEGSRDFTVSKKAFYDLSYTLTFTDDGNAFEPFDNVKNAK